MDLDFHIFENISKIQDLDLHIFEIISKIPDLDRQMYYFWNNFKKMKAHN